MKEKPFMRLTSKSYILDFFENRVDIYKSGCLFKSCDALNIDLKETLEELKSEYVPAEETV